MGCDLGASPLGARPFLLQMRAALGYGAVTLQRIAAMKPIYVMNGPNLNLLGMRQPDIYGHETLNDVNAAMGALAGELGLTVHPLQSNHEGQLVDWIHEARGAASGIIINPGAYSHTSVAILDALNTFEGPVLEVHISNIHKREAFRHHSFVSARAEGVIAGFGTEGYLLALRRMATLARG
jgi:3-dehydroquinate dehydratase-2